MDRAQALHKVEHLFREIFDDDEVVVSESLDRQSFASWDSLGHIRLVSALEDAFSVSFTIEEIEAMNSVGRILDRLSEKA